MKKKLNLFILAVLIALIFPSVGFSEEFKNFHYNSKIEIKGNRDDFILLEFTPKIYSSIKQGFEDLRLYNEREELDYLVLTQSNKLKKSTKKELEVLNEGTVGNTYSFVVKGSKGINSNNIQYSIILKPRRYLVKAKIYGSNDLKHWKYLKIQTIYGIDGEYNRFSLKNIKYDFIKFEYDLKDARENLKADYVEASLVHPFEYKKKVHNVNFTSKENPGNKTTDILIDNKYKQYPSSQITLEVDEKYFYREVALSGSNDKENWNNITKAFVFRDTTSEKLYISYKPKEYRYMRMTFYNKDNRSLTIKDIKLEVPPLYLLVNTSNVPKDFTINAYWGNPALSFPKYDISNLNISLDPSLYKKYLVSSYSENTTFIGEKKQLPLTERFVWLMPASLFILTVGAAIFLYKTVKKID